MTVSLEQRVESHNKHEFLSTYETPSSLNLELRQEALAQYVPPAETERLGSIIPQRVQAEIVHAENSPVGSFKIRGALYNVMEAIKRGKTEFATTSAGNHSQGVGWAVNTLSSELDTNLHATIFMPEGTPERKVAGTKAHGGEHVSVIVAGNSLEASRDIQNSFIGSSDVEVVEPYDSHDTIKGQSTLPFEALKNKPETKKLFVQVGGGGLLAASLEVVAALKAESKLDQSCKVVAVVYEGNDSLINTIQAGGTPQRATHVSTLCEGAAVDTIGDIPAQLIDLHREHLEVISVNAAELGEAAVAWEERHASYASDSKRTYQKPETTGLLAEAGMLKYAKLEQNRMAADKELWQAICSGANGDPVKWEQAKNAHLEHSREQQAIQSPARKRPLGQLACKVISSPALISQLK